MARGKADFKARREQLGLTQQDVAQALTVNVKTVKNWENPRQTRYRISDAAWEYLDRAADVQAQQVAYARSVIEAQSEALAGNTVVVPITYYRDQATYDRFGREAGPFGQANANARAIASELERMGIQVEFRYPDDGAISTPGSNY
ncbi:Helix-turn-helix domain protein [Collinsella aerofaciens]|nr:Helix-turn-helix domain protein [Collinsella aerofaciens]